MPASFVLRLTSEQRTALEAARDHDPHPYVRERASGLLKVADGASLRQVAHFGLLRRRRPETVRAWIGRYQTLGLSGLVIAPGRGRRYLHSPDPAYDAKLRTITGVQLLARACPEEIVLRSEDELTSSRRAPVARAWTAGGADDPRVDQGVTANQRRRIAVGLDATTGALVYWQRARFAVPTRRAFYEAVADADPEAERIFIAVDNWPVPFDTPTPERVTLLPLPTYAPWTNPCEDLWRGLTSEVRAHHPHGDDWAAVQHAVTVWLDRQATEPTAVLHRVGLPT